jgi:serine/threonine protein kinase
LGNAVLHFFQEKLKSNPRVKTAMDTLMDQTLFEQLDRSEFKQDLFRKELGQTVARLELLVKEQNEQSPILNRKLAIHRQMLEKWSNNMLFEARKSWSHVTGQMQTLQAEMGDGFNMLFHQQEDMLFELNELADSLQRTHKVVEKTHSGVIQLDGKVSQVQGDVSANRASLESIEQQLRMLMESYGSTTLLAFHQKSAKQRELLSDLDHDNLRKFASVLESADSKTTDFQRNAFPVAVALSTKVGDVTSRMLANKILTKLCDAVPTEEVQGKAYFLQFQNFICLKMWDQAKQALEQAVHLNEIQYKLHDVDRYPLERVLGASVSGCMFHCKKRSVDDVVVKSLWQIRQGEFDELFKEAIGISDMEMPIIPRLIRCGYANLNERPFVVMDGTNLGGALDGHSFIVANGPLQISDGLRIGLELASCLHALHLKKFVHLDVKPSNLLLSKTDAGIKLRLLDAGFASAVPSFKERLAQLDSRNVFAQQYRDELPYNAPEIRGEIPGAEPGPKSDLFGFGATMYWLLTYRTPKKITKGSIGFMGLEDLLLECLDDDPYERPNTALEVVEKLRELIAEYEFGAEGQFKLYLAQEFSDFSLTPFARKTALQKANEYGLEETMAVSLLDDFEKQIPERAHSHREPTISESLQSSGSNPYVLKTLSPVYAAEGSPTYAKMLSLSDEQQSEAPPLAMPVLANESRTDSANLTEDSLQVPQGFVSVTPGLNELGDTVRQLTVEQEAKLIEATNKIVEKIKQVGSTEDFWNDSIAQRQLRSWVEELLDHPDIIDDMERAEIATDRVMALARQIRYRFIG